MNKNAIQMLLDGKNAYPNNAEIITNSNGTALKYADGTMICYGKRTFTNISTTQQISYIWYTGTIYYGNFPVEFSSIPCCFLFPGDTSLNPIEHGGMTKANIGYGWLWNPTKRENQNVVIDFIAIGRWFE